MSNSEMKERCPSCGTLRTGGWETAVVQGEALCRPQADPWDNLLQDIYGARGGGWESREPG